MNCFGGIMGGSIFTGHTYLSLKSKVVEVLITNDIFKSGCDNSLDSLSSPQEKLSLTFWGDSYGQVSSPVLKRARTDIWQPHLDATRLDNFYNPSITPFCTLNIKFPISEILEELFLKNCKYSEVSTMNLSCDDFGQNMLWISCINMKTSGSYSSRVKGSLDKGHFISNRNHHFLPSRE